MIPLLGFAPDVDPTTPGVITDCSQIIPTLKGIAGAPTPYDVGVAALAAECRGGAVVLKLDDTRRVFAGTQTKMYELSGGVWVDVSRVGDYTGGPENRWRYAQFGNATIASNQTERIQASITGAFADIAQAPKARIVVTAAGFVVAFGIDDAAVGGDRPDAWWCSNIFDYITWTPGASNQAANGYLLDTPGEIRAAKRLGTEIAVYKERSIYIGRYVGPPVIWSFQPIPSDVGALSDDCVVDTGTEHLFIGHDDFWEFDGSRPRPIGGLVREWFFNNSDADFRFKTTGYFDRFTNRVWWFFCGLDSDGTLNEALIYNIDTKKWGRATTSIQAAFDYFVSETTFDNWPPGDPTDFENIVDLSFDSEYFDTRQFAPGIIDETNTLKTLNGPCASSSFTTGDFGDDDQYTTLEKVTPRYLSRPTTATLTHYTKAFEGDTATERSSSALSGNKFDALASGRFHSVEIASTGDFEIAALKPKLIPDGEE